MIKLIDVLKEALDQPETGKQISPELAKLIQPEPKTTKEKVIRHIENRQMTMYSSNRLRGELEILKKEIQPLEGVELKNYLTDVWAKSLKRDKSGRRKDYGFSMIVRDCINIMEKDAEAPSEPTKPDTV